MGYCNRRGIRAFSANQQFVMMLCAAVWWFSRVFWKFWCFSVVPCRVRAQYGVPPDIGCRIGREVFPFLTNDASGAGALTQAYLCDNKGIIRAAGGKPFEDDF